MPISVWRKEMLKNVWTQIHLLLLGFILYQFCAFWDFSETSTSTAPLISLPSSLSSLFFS